MLFLVPALVHAQPSTVRRVDPEEARARALFKEGQTAYDVGEFERALELFAEAYKVRPLPGFLFNLGQCHRRLGHWKEAAFFFGRFLDTSRPDAPNLALARNLKTQVEAELAQRPTDAPVVARLEPSPLLEPGPALPAPPPPPVAEAPLHERGWFWAVLGGAVVVVGGAVAAAVVLSQPVPYTPSVTTLADIDGRTR